MSVLEITLIVVVVILLAIIVAGLGWIASTLDKMFRR